MHNGLSCSLVVDMYTSVSFSVPAKKRGNGGRIGVGAGGIEELMRILLCYKTCAVAMLCCK